LELHLMKTLIALLLASSSVAMAAPPGSAGSGIILGERPISRTEVTAFVKQQFATMDSNKDGAVSPSEFQAFRAREDLNVPGGLGHIGGRWFEKSDADGDGRVTLAEALERPLQMFDMADLNRDGVASVEEQSMARLLLGK
jgi:Ca2+-binding EF-hand superfamily protein